MQTYLLPDLSLIPLDLWFRGTIPVGESLVTMPSALVREIWDEKWQLSRPGPLYLNLFLEIYF